MHNKRESRERRSDGSDVVYVLRKPAHVESFLLLRSLVWKRRNRAYALRLTVAMHGT